MICPFCKQELEEHVVRNPFGLARIDVLACPKCYRFGTKDLWLEVQK